MAVGCERLRARTRRCAICEHDQAEFLFRPKSAPGPVVRCRRCGLPYVSSVQDGRAVIHDGPVLGGLDRIALTSADPSDIAGCWELSELPAKEAEWPALQLNAVDALERLEHQIHVSVHPFGRPRLLDYGCGWGFVLTVARERGWEPYGLEPLPGRAVYARARSGGTVVCDILRDDTFPPCFFDAVTAFQVFEHLPDPARELARLHRLLKPGGLILIEVPTIDTWSVRLLGPRHRHFVPDHLTFFSARTLAVLLETRGFRTLNARHPARRMTVRHLVADWGGRYLPQHVVSAAGALARRLGVWEGLVSVNLGDIVEVIARKEG
jgi:SAM-dependent methyltransferase